MIFSADGAGVEALVECFARELKRENLLAPPRPERLWGDTTPAGCTRGWILASPTQGEVQIAGRQVNGPYTDIGIVFQNAELLEWRTSLQNILLQIEIRKLPTRQYLPAARQLLANVGSEGF